MPAAEMYTQYKLKSEIQVSFPVQSPLDTEIVTKLGRKTF